MTDGDPLDTVDLAPPRDRSLAIGIALSLLILGLGGAWLGLRGGTAPSPGELGGFVAALAGPIAVVWFVLALRLQAAELRLQRQELGLQRAALVRQRQALRQVVEQAQVQVEVLRETRSLARRESFLRLLELSERKLALEAAQISALTAIDRAATERHQAAWRAYEGGERNAVFRHLIGQFAAAGAAEFARRVDQVASGRGLLERFAATAAEILAEAAAVDERLAALCRSSEWAHLAGLVDGLRATSPGRS